MAEGVQPGAATQLSGVPAACAGGGDAEAISSGTLSLDVAPTPGAGQPLGTHPAYRKRGLARALLLEGLRLLKAMGMEKMPMTGGFDPFYESFGFRKLRTGHMWEKQPGVGV